MLRDQDNSLFLSLKQMVRCCQEMHQLMENDRSNFERNRLDLIDESNQQKNILISKLSVLVEELNSRYPDGLIKNYIQNANNLTSAAQHEILNVIDELKSEITKCYKYITINSNIVFFNLQQIKEIWDKLLACKPTVVYDRAGLTVK